MPTTTTHHDVVVVGARAAGAATAMLLARAGLDVLVVDRSRAGTDTLSTHALLRGGVIQLHRWGLLDAVIAAGTPAVRRTTFTYADVVVPVEIKPSHGIDAFYAPRRTILDPLLAGAAEEAGAEVRYGTRITGVSRISGGRGAAGRVDAGRVNGVVGVDHLGNPVHHKARWVIGADGMSSAVADAVAAPIERRGSGATALVYGYWTGLDNTGYEWVFRPNASAGAIPTNHGETCVFVAATPRRIGRGGIGVLRDIVAAASPDLAARLSDAVAPTGVRYFGGRPGHLRRPWGDGWALVGDAGYWKDPISAHGLTDALRDAELLAGAVIDTASGRRPEPTAFADYHRTRNRLSVGLFDVVETIAGMRWTDAEIPELLLALSASMADEVETLTALTPPNEPLPIAGGG
jgi:2-polyprenyl-6-methoxyphenol hydroxylase-like FAD-dependent oxidoreductase